MLESPPLNRKLRAPRVNLWGTVSATVQLENGRQLWANTVRLSMTGGLLEMAACLDEQIPVGVTLHLKARTIRGKATMLFPMRATEGYLQPFRFTDLREQEGMALQTEIGKLLEQTKPMAPRRPGSGLRSSAFSRSPIGRS
jgi:hypothetical protein